MKARFLLFIPLMLLSSCGGDGETLGPGGNNQDGVKTSSTFPLNELQAYLDTFLTSDVEFPYYTGGTSYIYMISKDGGTTDIFHVAAYLNSASEVESAASGFSSYCSTYMNYTVTSQVYSGITIYTAVDSTNQLKIQCLGNSGTVDGTTVHAVSFAYMPAYLNY
ncbi:MAG: hypothetical protein IJQ72_03510 [Bacilli bacterium]|nr:hypothetical protein [Bacilli bacterium]